MRACSHIEEEICGCGAAKGLFVYVCIVSWSAQRHLHINPMSFTTQCFRPKAWGSPPMSYVWLYCIDILMSGNCQGLSIEGYHPPNFPQIQSMILPTPSSNISLLLSWEFYPPVSLEICPPAYIEVCLLYQSVFCDFRLDKGLYMLHHIENIILKHEIMKMLSKIMHGKHNIQSRFKKELITCHPKHSNPCQVCCGWAWGGVIS